jgi:hypothetical protein
MTTSRPGLGAVILKVGTLGDPAICGGPMIAIYAEEEQALHLVPQGVPKFEKPPPTR